MRAVRMRASIKQGLGRSGEAGLWRDGALAGLANDGMRDLAIAEIAVHASIIRALPSRHIDSRTPPIKSQVRSLYSLLPRNLDNLVPPL